MKTVLRKLSRAALVPLLLLPALGACDSADSVEPAVEEPDVEVKKEMTVGHLTVGTVAYSPCPPFWQGGEQGGVPPRADTVLVDLYLGGAAHGDRPTDEEERAIEKHGEVVHSFSVSVIRAVLPTEALPRIISDEGAANHARWVPDRNAFNVKVHGGAPAALQDSVVTIFERMGGVFSRSWTGGGFSGAAPDSVLPGIWKRFDEGLGSLALPSIWHCLH